MYRYRIHTHPQNPRLAPRVDVVEQIAAQIAASGEFDPAHALIVRQNASGFEIVSGHHRKLAAEKAGLESVPCWVRELSDEDAYMALALNNAQGELSALERGIHALGATEKGSRVGKSVSAYADAIGRSPRVIAREIDAADMATAVGPYGQSAADLQEFPRHLAEMHSAPRWLWPALVSRLVADTWTVEAARREAQKLKDIPEPPDWADRDAIASALVAGEMKPGDVAKMAKAAADALAFHRIEAFRLLGRPEIDAVFFNGSDVEAELWEISENLHRSELTKLEYGEQVARWIELKNVEGVLGQVDPKPHGGRPESGLRAAARELPLDGTTDEAKRSDARRALKIASLSEDAKAVRPRRRARRQSERATRRI